MPWYRCFVLGENFTLVEDGARKEFGFYTTRWVEADDPASAELKALEILKADESLIDMPEDQKNPDARVYFQEIEELSEKPNMAPGAGFTWFPMEEEAGGEKSSSS